MNRAYLSTNKTALKNLGFLIMLFMGITASSQDLSVDTLPGIPPAVGTVNDFVKLFEKEEVKSLDSLIEAIKKQTTIQVAVASIDSSMMGYLSLEDYALRMLRAWGVGDRKKNNGILIVIAPGIRRMRVENGYGIEKYLSNEETKEIVDDVFIPHFKENQFFLGTKNGIIALIEKLQSNGYH